MSQPPFVQIIHKQADEIMTQAAEAAAPENVFPGMQTFFLTRAVLLLVKTIATIAGRHE